jgi:hypothetical protein
VALTLTPAVWEVKIRRITKGVTKKVSKTPITTNQPDVGVCISNLSSARTKLGYNTYKYGSSTKKISVHLCKTSKNVIFFLLLFLYTIREQQGGTGPIWNVGKWQSRVNMYGAFSMYICT